MGMVAYLFYDSAWAALPLLPAGYWYYREWEKGCLRRKAAAFQTQFLDAVQSICASLNVGYSIENAMKEAKKDLNLIYGENTAIQREFTLILRRLFLNVPVEQAMEEWAERVRQEDVQNFVSVFVTARKSGGDIIAIMRNTADQIREKVEVAQEIETILTSKKYEFQVMSVVPFAIIAYMRWSFPDFMGHLYGNVPGAGVMTACLGIYAGAWYLGGRIVNIEI